MMTMLIKKVEESVILRNVIRGIIMGLMLASIFYYLLGKDFSTSPEFIYNQF